VRQVNPTCQYVYYVVNGDFSPSILVRSGIGPEADLTRLGLPIVENLPVGEKLLDHYGTGLGWEPSDRLHDETTTHEQAGPLFEAHVVIKAASSVCDPASFDLHLLPWTNPGDEPGRYEASTGLFLMKPASSGRLRVRSTDPSDAPEVTRGFLSDSRDIAPLLEGIELARSLARAEPLRSLLATELRPGSIEPERYLRSTVRNYFHPAGTCAMGDWDDEGERP